MFSVLTTDYSLVVCELLLVVLLKNYTSEFVFDDKQFKREFYNILFKRITEFRNRIFWKNFNLLKIVFTNV